MRPARAICELIHLAALGVAVGAIAITGVTAAMAFPAMKALDPRLPAFAAYDGPHWPIAAGSVMNGVFGASAVLVLVAAVVATVTFAAGFRGFKARARPVAMALRTFAVAALLMSSVATTINLGPRMQADLGAYWSAARAGDSAGAAAHKAAFDAAHPRATFLLAAQLGLAALAFATGAWHALRGGPLPPPRGEGGGEGSSSSRRD